MWIYLTLDINKYTIYVTLKEVFNYFFLKNNISFSY